MSLYSTEQINGFNGNNYVQVKPNKMIRAELLQKDTARKKNPQYVRTKPNKIVRTISTNPIIIPVQSAINSPAKLDKALPVTISDKVEKPKTATAPVQILFGHGTNPNKYTRPEIAKKKTKEEDRSSREAPTPPFKTKLINQYCKYFHKCGRCKDGDKCAYKHNPARVAVCKTWLNGDRCKMGVRCPLQHEESPHVVPHCRHFNHGLCINPKCHYTHVHVNSKAPYCPYFDKDKYCPRGEECKLKHEWRFANFEDETEQTNASSSDSNEFGKRKRQDDLKRKIRIKQPGEEIDPFKAQFDYISLEDYSTDPK